MCLVCSYKAIFRTIINPRTPRAISKLLEMIGRSAYFPRPPNSDRSRLGHKPDCRLAWSSEYVRKSMRACHGVSVACRPTETRRRRGEIGRSIGQFSCCTGGTVGVRGLSSMIDEALFIPRTPRAISKLLEMIGRSAYFPRPPNSDRSRLRHKPDCRLAWSSEYVRKSMRACHGVSVVCRPAETRRRRNEIGSVHRSILVLHRWHSGRQRVIIVSSNCFIQVLFS